MIAVHLDSKNQNACEPECRVGEVAVNKDFVRTYDPLDVAVCGIYSETLQGCQQCQNRATLLQQEKIGLVPFLERGCVFSRGVGSVQQNIDSSASKFPLPALGL